MMDSTSSFSEVQQNFPDAELLQVGGSTCDCYRVKLYGKLHFLKRLKPQLRTHPQYVAALQKEFETGYSLDHPHLVRYTAKTDDGILMDYVDGETLNQFVEHHPDYFTHRKNADRFLQQLLSVVGYLHSHQIVHLDLKPDNILLSRIGHNVKLIDLGYCYADCFTDTTGRTDKYAAPEQTDGSAKVDARTDIYAIGRILQVLPCARFYNKVIKRCTERQMQLRYASADELQQAVGHRRNPWWWVAALAVALAVVALFLFERQQVTTLPPLSQPDSSATQKSRNPSTTEVPAPTPPILVPPPNTSPPVKHSEVTAPAPTTIPAEQGTYTDENGQRSTDSGQQSADESQKPAITSKLPEDTLALRRELQRLIGTRFKKALGHYNDSIYYHINQQRYAQLWIVFEESLMPLYGQVWKEFQDKVGEHTMSTEWCQTILYYSATQLWQMMRNDPDHDPSYDGKVFRYYDEPC
jgi:serine/threonine protein kinase